jgi:two-component system chemotaxis response regulator CheY
MGQSRFGRGTRVLVVDDNADLRLTTKLLLEAEGYVVETAANGAEALRIQRERPSHILITDLFMPEVDGLETVQSFHAAFPGMPVIVISGGSSRGQDQADHLSVARELGAMTLRKPVEPQALIEALRTV